MFSLVKAPASAIDAAMQVMVAKMMALPEPPSARMP
jgi:hypothetical protein